MKAYDTSFLLNAKFWIFFLTQFWLKTIKYSIFNIVNITSIFNISGNTEPISTNKVLNENL